MSRARHPDKPDYAINVIEGAKPISTQLSVATGILTVLLIVMSAVATPMRPQDPIADDTQATGMEETSSSGQEPWCLSANKVRDWIAVVAA